MTDGVVPPALILASHGRMSVESLNSAKQILGEFEPVRAISFEPGQNLDDLASLLASALSELDPDGSRGAVILVDLFGGSCSNVAVKILRERRQEDGQIKLLAGYNLAMILEFASSRERYEIDELVLRMVAAGQKACFDVGLRFAAAAMSQS